MLWTGIVVGIIIGIFIGTNVGIFILGMCMAADKGDQPSRIAT